MDYRVFIGFDEREVEAYRVAEASLLATASSDVLVTPLRADRLQATGLLRRPIDGRDGRLYDFTSNAYQSTWFAVSRFLVPILAHTGWALFVDCDVVFLDDVAKLFALADPSKAVQVVKHVYQPKDDLKMVSQVQTPYPCKNWSSVMLFNCDHKGHRRLSLDAINNRPGRDLHNFFWLADTEIGELPAGWNWLVDEQPKPDPLSLAHYTLGGPWLPNWEPRASDALWLEAKENLL